MSWKFLDRRRTTKQFLCISRYKRYVMDGKSNQTSIQLYVMSHDHMLLFTVSNVTKGTTGVMPGKYAVMPK